MKITVEKPVEIEVSHLRMVLPVRYEEEDIPNDFPFRKNDVWDATVEIDTGKIVGWPTEYGEANMHMKVVDGGTYILLAPDGSEIERREGEYVPRIVPGEYGDYVILRIEPDGTIKNWKSANLIARDLDQFFTAE